MNPETIFKIVCIGDKEVGRSTLFKESLNMSYYSENYIETVGVDIFQKELAIGGWLVNLKIWNVSNKDYFSNLLSNYINCSDGVLLMFDLTNLRTLNYLLKFPQLIRDGVGEIPVLLLGNKVDLEEDREVSEEKGKIFAEENNLTGYIEISAKTGEGCDGIFELLAEKIMRQMQLH